MKKITMLTCIAFMLFAFSCSKDNGSDEINSNEEFELNISFSDLDANLKDGNLSKSAQTLDDAQTIVLTIKTLENEATKYTNEKLDIYKVGDNYFSQKLSLQTGDYKLTAFFLLDGNNNVIYATPLIGSQQAQNVDNPLPIVFLISKDHINSVAVEVLSTENLTPEDFGLVSFNFSEVPTFSFIINVSEWGQMDSLLTSSLLISNDTYSYSQDLEAIATNIVTIKDGFSDYTLKITKTGYIDFEETFTIDSLKQHATFPLTIELEKQENETVTDIDGNVYHTVTIGTQVWMVENLKTTRYRDGTSIPNITNDTAWLNTTTGAYCDYNNNPSNSDIYGRIYNWNAVNDARNIAPEGWHVPTDAEWSTLTTYLEDANFAGGKLKEIGTTHWTSPNTGATNETGFSALPGGVRLGYNGRFDRIENFGYWWSSTIHSEERAWYRRLSYDNNSVIRNYSVPSAGISIRCIKD